MIVTRTYLELDPTAAAPVAPRPDAPELELRRRDVDVAGYRALYAAVGDAYHWHDRDAWSDERLRAHLAQPSVHVWVATQGDAPVGYFELVDDAAAGAVEIAYFGLVAAAQGRGLGRALLERAIEEGWRLGARRLWLHTCTLDHPAALPNYLRRGFRVVREEQYEATIPGEAGAPTATPPTG